MNVTLETYGITEIKGAKKDGIFEDWNIAVIEREE